jgi:hypothetical protein
MQYLVQMRLASSSRATTPQEGIAFIEQFIFPTCMVLTGKVAEGR